MLSGSAVEGDGRVRVAIDPRLHLVEAVSSEVSVWHAICRVPVVSKVFHADHNVAPVPRVCERKSRLHDLQRQLFPRSGLLVLKPPRLPPALDEFGDVESIKGCHRQSLACALCACLPQLAAASLPFTPPC